MVMGILDSEYSIVFSLKDFIFLFLLINLVAFCFKLIKFDSNLMIGILDFVCSW